MGIAEQNMVGTAAGLAATGKIVFASTFAIFLTGRAWEQVRQSVAFPNHNVKLVSSHGGVTVGPDGASHQSTEDISLMRTIPNMKVVVPADACEMKKVLEYAASFYGPIYIRMSREKFPVLFDETFEFQIGKGNIIAEGGDATIIACGLMVYIAREAARGLQKEGINVRVVNMSSIKPIDAELIEDCARNTGAIVTAEEHSIIGGLGSAVAEIAGERFPVPMLRIGIPDSFGITGKPHDLLLKFGLTEKNIITQVKKAINLKPKKKA
jgi:transketolase